jgi:hypothetical protein
MSLVAIYEIRCPNGHATELPETILEGIIHYLQVTYTGVHPLNFVCSECKTAFHFDYPNRVPVGHTDAPRRISEFHVATVQCECDGSNCGDHVALVALRSRDITVEAIELEKKVWNISGAKCERGYRALPLGTHKYPPIQYFGGSL